MNRDEILYKISHYEWMLSSRKLAAGHELWIRDQLEDLNAALAKLYPASHPVNIQRAKKASA